MGKLFDSALKKIGLARVRSKPGQLRKRGYEAGNLNRLTSDFNSFDSTGDAVISDNLGVLINRSRILERDNEWASRYFRALENNVLKEDTGFSLQMKAKKTDGSLDTNANEVIESAWRDWCMKMYCTVTGEDSFYDVMKLSLRRAAVDGGILLRKIRDTKSKYGFTLQLFEVDHLDIWHNEQRGENRIVMGVEKNKAGRTVAYWMLDSHPGDRLFGASPHNRVRVPAEEIIHYFVKERPTQCRGVPWITPSILALNHLGKYEQAELIAAREAAEKGGFFTSERGDKYPGEEDDGNGTSESSGVISDYEPGQKDELPPGMKFIQYDPTHPTQQFGDFVRSRLLGISAGMSISYATLTGDLSEASYSSMRGGSLEEREGYKKIQCHMIQHLCLEIFHDWLESAMTVGAIPISMSQFARVNAPQFRGRRWPWVDPQNDIAAAIMSIQGGLSSRTKWTEENGDDLEELFATLKYEKELAEESGLVFNVNNPNVSQPAKAESMDDEEESPNGSPRFHLNGEKK